MKSRLLNYGIAFLVILCLNFLLPRLMPGDPLQAIYGDEALLQMTAETKAEITARFGLDQPVWKQFGNYLWRLAQGDLGYSFYHKAAVSEVIAAHLPWTLLLVGSGLVLATLAGIALGIESGWRRGSALDRGLLTFLMSASGFPSFFLGILLLLLFGVTLGWLPLQGARTAYGGLSGLPLVVDVLEHLVLPAGTLLLAFLPGMYLLTRNSTVTVRGEPYILTARAKGLPDWKVRYHHGARTAMLPVVTATGLLFASRMITGALFVEIVFSYPGMGSLIHNSLIARDYPVLQGTLFVTTVLVLATNFGVDLLYRSLDPRVKDAR